METVDSKKNQLTMQEVMIRSIHAQKDQFEVPLDQAFMLLVEELKMENSEAIQFGNTVFVTHYSPESPTCFMYALNIDTAKNFVNNGEMYVRRLINKGMKGFMTSYTTESFGLPFKQIKKNRLGEVHSYKQGKRFVTAVLFNQSKKDRANV